MKRRGPNTIPEEDGSLGGRFVGEVVKYDLVRNIGLIRGCNGRDYFLHSENITGHAVLDELEVLARDGIWLKPSVRVRFKDGGQSAGKTNRLALDVQGD